MYTDSNKHVEHAVMSTGYYIMIMIHFSTIVEVQLIKELPINIKLEVQQFLLHTMIFFMQRLHTSQELALQTNTYGTRNNNIIRLCLPGEKPVHFKE
jgi:hypothetical protein